MEDGWAPLPGDAPLTTPAEGPSLLPVLSILAPTLLAAPVRAAEAEASAGAGALEIVVEESAPDGNPDETPAALTVVRVDERLPASADVGTALQGAAGVVVRRFGGLGDWSGVSIRGSGLRHVLVCLDGVPLNPDGASAVDLSELPLAVFERVEVWRSNPPVRYGAPPLGGVVDLVTPGGPIPSGVSVAAGSYGTARIVATGSAEGTLAGRRADALAFAELFATRGDFPAFSDNGTPYEMLDDHVVERRNNDKAQLSALARARWGDAVRVALTDAFLQRDEGLPGRIEAQAEHARLDTTRNLAALSADLPAGALRVRPRAWSLVRVETLDDREGEVGTGTQWSTYRFRTEGLALAASWAPSHRLSPALALEARRERFVEDDLLAGEMSDPRVRLAGHAALSVDAWLADDRVRITPAVGVSALDNRFLGDVPYGDTAVATRNRDVEVVATPRAGLLVRPWERLALKANVVRAWRPPDLTELFGDRGSSVGNTDLSPERGTTWDAGLRARIGGEHRGAVVEATYFRSRIRDRIVYVQNGQGVSVPVNFGDTFAQGVEAGLDLRAGGWLDARTSATWTMSRNLTPRADVANRQLPRTPTWQVHQETGVHHGEAVRLGHTWDYVAGNYWDATNWFLAPPRSIHGAFLRVGGPRLSAELSVLNLFDETVALVDRNPLDDADDTRIVKPISDFDGYPLPGRTWLLTVRWVDSPPSKEK